MTQEQSTLNEMPQAVHPARPRVVVMPGNDVTCDARVLKYVATLSSLGLDVVALGVTRAGKRRTGQLGSARLIVESVPLPVGSLARARGRQLAVVLRPGYRTVDDREAARAQLARWTRRAGSQWGMRRIALLGALLVPRAWSRVAAIPLRLGRGSDTQRQRFRASRRAEHIRRYLAEPDRSRWRSVLPEVLADDEVLGARLDQLAPDVIHVHDVFMIGVATAAARRAEARGRTVKLVYDAREYVPGLAHLPPRVIGAYSDLEREFIGSMDRIVTVSAPLADLLVTDHALAVRPTLVLNAPTVATPPPGFRSLREQLGLDPEVPLLVYGGAVNPSRGVQTAVAALPELPEVHLAVVTNQHNYAVEQLVRQAAQLGASDRFHLATFVPPEHVVAHLQTASVGLSTLLRAPNHDVALTNKFCEYVMAKVPVVTSDTPAQADLVTELGLGTVYRADSVASLVTAVREVLTNHEYYQHHLDSPELRHRFSWEAQAEALRQLYSELLGELPPEAWGEKATRITEVSTVMTD